MAASEYLKNLDLAQMDRFHSGLKTGESRIEEIWNEDHSKDVYVKSLGHLNPQQFKEQYEPQMVSSWEQGEKDTYLHKTVDYKMNELVKSIKKNGIVRPVIVGHPVKFLEGEKTHPPELLDGLHRVIAAGRAGVDIPVNILDIRHQSPNNRYATYNLSTRHEYNPAFDKPKSRRNR